MEARRRVYVYNIFFFFLILNSLWHCIFAAMKRDRGVKGRQYRNASTKFDATLSSNRVNSQIDDDNKKNVHDCSAFDRSILLG